MAKLKLTNAIAEDLKTAASDSFIDSLKMIEIEDIQPNEDNFYEMSEIEELTEDIERQGLMSVLIVETAENGKYRLISGHRRLTAIKRLVDEGRYKSTTVPCYVKSAKSHEESVTRRFSRYPESSVQNLSPLKSTPRTSCSLWQPNSQRQVFRLLRKEQLSTFPTMHRKPQRRLRLLTTRLSPRVSVRKSSWI